MRHVRLIIHMASFMQRRHFVYMARPTLHDEAKWEPEDSPRSPEKTAAKIQALVRGHSARKLYGELLYDKYAAEEEADAEAERKRMEEGMRLLEKKKTEQDLLEKSILEDHLRKTARLAEGVTREDGGK
jgi:hypothetical protein